MRKPRPTLPPAVYESAVTRSYAPLNAEFAREKFCYMFAVFNVAKAWRIIDALPLEERSKRLHRMKITENMIAVVCIDTERAMTDSINLEIPLLVAQMDPPNRDGRHGHLLIDGHHRVYKALKQRYTHLLGFLLTVDETKECRLR